MISVCKDIKQLARNLDMIRSIIVSDKAALKELHSQFGQLKELAREVSSSLYIIIHTSKQLIMLLVSVVIDLRD
jgi:hypothetical protein